MRTRTLVLAFLAFASSVSADAEKLAGRQWKGLSEQRRIYYVFAMREKLQEKGIVFSVPAGDYPEMISATLRKTPAFLDLDLDDAFLETVATVEPGARAILKKN